MDVKSVFINRFIHEEVYVKQPRFENSSYPNHVFKLSKVPYSLKQSPKAWYYRLSTFLLNNYFQRGKADTTFFTQKFDPNLHIVQIYVNDIIFGNPNISLYENFANLMKGEFEINLIGELTFFQEIQIKQTPKGTFISQAKYIKELIKKFGMKKEKDFGTPMSPSLKS